MTTNFSKTHIYNFTYKEIEDKVLEWGEPNYRANQIWCGLYKNFWLNPDDFSNLPQYLRARLAQEYSFQQLTPIDIKYSKDGITEKTLFQLPDDETIETVLMVSINKESPEQLRNTLCISSQIGCAIGCDFCATGQMGFTRNLHSGEIIEQVLHYAEKLKAEEQKIDNIVFMGMGEPFQNYEAVLNAVKRLNDPLGFKMGARRITISTVGLIPGIKRLSKESMQVNLAVSLHAADDALRNQLVPINNKYPLKDLMNSCLNYLQHSRRRITFEWALIEGVNDTVEQANKLVRLLADFHQNGGWLCHVNLIPLNRTSKYPGRASTRYKVGEFMRILDRERIPCTIRFRHGEDIYAGCGQLAAERDTK